MARAENGMKTTDVLCHGTIAKLFFYWTFITNEVIAPLLCSSKIGALLCRD